MEGHPATPVSRDGESVNGSWPATPIVAIPITKSRTPLGMHPLCASQSSLPSSGQSYKPPIRQNRFVPPTRIVPPKAEIKTEPIEMVDEEEPIGTFEEDEDEDVKPSIDGIGMTRVEGKRKRSSTPEGRGIKSTVPGSRHMPIAVDEVEAVDIKDRRMMAQLPRLPCTDGRPIIIRNVVYNITYNVVNNVVQPGNGHPAPQPPPPYAPLPGIKASTPPPAPAIEDIDPDFIPRRHVPRAKPQPVAEPEPEFPTLSPTQQKILDMVLSGKSVMIHGAAGTGKSVLIRAIKKAFESRYEALNPSDPKPDALESSGALAQAKATGDYSRLSMTAEERVAHPLPEQKWKLRVTASTGLAGVNIGGTTFHSFIGAGLCRGEIADLVEMIRKTSALDEWTSTAALIIDEISMVDGQFFDIVDQIARKVRRNNRPFGGLQIIACGDFLQLASVPDDYGKGYKTSTFTFVSRVWRDLFPSRQTFNLERNFRQEDMNFQRLLERMRRGYPSQADCKLLQGLKREPIDATGVKPVFLMPSKSEVRDKNEAELETCPGPTRTYFSKDIPGTTAAGVVLSRDEATKMLNEETRFPVKLDLRVGAQVMLIMNMKEPFLVNGTTGCVTDFMTREEAEHAGIPEPSLIPFFDPPRNVRYPVIRFAKMRHCKYTPPPAMLVASMSIDVTTSKDIRVATRSQVPMILAWALTIHKAQGQTLDKVKVDVGKCFAAGQAYTAISRVTSKEGLQLLNFNLKRVRVDRVAERWVRELEGDDEYGLYADQPDF